MSKPSRKASIDDGGHIREMADEIFRLRGEFLAAMVTLGNFIDIYIGTYFDTRKGDNATVMLEFRSWILANINFLQKIESLSNFLRAKKNVTLRRTIGELKRLNTERTT